MLMSLPVLKRSTVFRIRLWLSCLPDRRRAAGRQEERCQKRHTCSAPICPRRRSRKNTFSFCADLVCSSAFCPDSTSFAALKLESSHSRQNQITTGVWILRGTFAYKSRAQNVAEHASQGRRVEADSSRSQTKANEEYGRKRPRASCPRALVLQARF